MAATRVEERLMCAMGFSSAAEVRFESCWTIPFGGVMFLLPFLLECGLMSYGNHYSQRLKGYYNFDNLFIITAFIYLCRIKSFEHLKHHSCGEFGKLVGYDRIPEVKKLRGMIREITAQKCVDKWAAELSQSWIAEDEPELYYIDGHVQVYHGYLANLGKKHVSRQRLCLPGVMEYWVNANDGKPYFYVTAAVNEKMIEMLNEKIVPKLLELHPVSDEHKKRMLEDENEPLFTLVFDREAYSPEFFAMLWEKYRIAIITYRKNVKEDWEEDLFEECSVPSTIGSTNMKLCEKEFQTPDGKYTMREVRKLCRDSRHQTSIVTTNKILPVIAIAAYMFARWVQENYFRYMRQEYAFDKILQYTVDVLNGELKVVNLEYSNIVYKIKKEREKLQRRKANLYGHDLKNPLELDEKEPQKWIKKRLEMIEEVQLIEKQIENLVKKRKETPCKIPIAQMPEARRYNRLNHESQMLQNVIKMICYRAETALANLIAPHYKRANQEIRALIKSVIRTPINMEVDREKRELKINLYSLANQRSNEAISKICETLNETNTIYPGTNLKLIYKIATMETVPSQEF
jgi:hypothetical protein